MTETGIAGLADKYLSKHDGTKTIKPLLLALGCTHVEGALVANKVVVPPQPAVNEVFLTQIMLRVLCTQPVNGGDFPEDSFSLLIGISAKQRWRACLVSLDMAYELAFAILASCIASPSMDAGLALMERMDTDLCVLLNDWASPIKPFRHAPDPLVVAQCLFGEAWCSLMIEDLPQRAYAIPSLIFEKRPPFMPGLLPEALDIQAVGLPVLEI